MLEIRFLGEQDGIPRRLLKERLADFFTRDKVSAGHIWHGLILAKERLPA